MFNTFRWVIRTGLQVQLKFMESFYLEISIDLSDGNFKVDLYSVWYNKTGLWLYIGDLWKKCMKGLHKVNRSKKHYFYNVCLSVYTFISASHSTYWMKLIRFSQFICWRTNLKSSACFNLKRHFESEISAIFIFLNHT